jgi:glycosyltransferase involved in cell wall biosynthesis
MDRRVTPDHFEAKDTSGCCSDTLYMRAQRSRATAVNHPTVTDSAVRALSIFLLVRSLEAGGAERQLVELARGLRERGQKVTVAIYYKRGPLLADLERTGAAIVDLRKKGRWDIFGFLGRVRQAIRNARPDVVYSFLGGANVVAAAVRPLAGAPRLVWSVRGTLRNFTGDEWLERLNFRIEQLMSKVPELIIANSHAGRVFAQARGFPAGRIEVIPNGIDTERFHPDPALRAEQRRRWGLRDDQIAVGVLSRFHPMKGIDVFLHACVRIAETRPDIRAFLVGNGREGERLRALAAQLGVSGMVTLESQTDDSVSVLNGLDIYCSSSVAGEGFSNSVAEAMACGLPCVVTDVGDSAAIVGDTGTVVMPANPEALATAILDMAGKLDRVDRSRIRSRVIDNFSLDVMVERTLELLRYPT